MNISKLTIGCALIGLLLAAIPVAAKYKPKPWTPSDPESYPARLTSEGVTIAVDPLYTDALAARYFDKNDIVSRGIMPLAVAIFNDNDFPVEVDALSIELIRGSDHIRSLSPNEVVIRLFQRDKTWRPKVPTVPRSDLNEEALDDFDSKFLLAKVIEPHSRGGGFLYLHLPEPKDIKAYLLESVVYIPRVYRRDNDSRLIFFEIGLSAAIPLD